MHINYHKAEKRAQHAAKERFIVERYIEGLNTLKELYNDRDYLSFVDDFNNNYIRAFEKSVGLATLRKTPVKYKTKQDIDDYFNPKK